MAKCFGFILGNAPKFVPFFEFEQIFGRSTPIIDVFISIYGYSYAHIRKHEDCIFIVGTPTSAVMSLLFLILNIIFLLSLQSILLIRPLNPMMFSLFGSFHLSPSHFILYSPLG